MSDKEDIRTLRIALRKLSCMSSGQNNHPNVMFLTRYYHMGWNAFYYLTPLGSDKHIIATVVSCRDAEILVPRGLK